MPTVTVNGNTPYYCTLRYSAGVPGALSIGCDLGTPAEPPAPSLVIGDVDLDGTVDVKDATMLQDCLENPESFEKLTSKQRKAADVNGDGVVDDKDLTALRNFLKLITINGPDVVCAQQDYEFTVTPPAGVTLDPQFRYNTDTSGRSADLEIDDDGVGHGTVSVEWYDLQTNCFTLTAHGTGPNGDTVRGTKTVRVAPEHIYVDGVCGCGAVKTVTVTVPFTITVKQGGSAAPRKTVFELELVDNQGKTLSFDGVTVSGTMTTTNGKGDYEGNMTFTGPSQQLRNMLGEGAFVRQVNGGKANWTYDDTVWGLWLFDGAAYATADSAGFIVLILPTTKNDAGDYYIDWDSLDLEKDVLKQMTFTNIYTRSTYRPSGNGSNTGTITSPQTGDNSNLAVWFALLAVSAAGVMGAGVYSKRRRSSR